MPDMIRDGTGGGYLAKVDSKNRLYTIANTMDLGLNTSLIKGDMYANILDVTPGGAGYCFLYMMNSRPGFDMVIGKMTVLTPTAEIIDIKKVSGIPSGGTAFVPSNRNLDFLDVALGTFQYGTNITGLTAATNPLTRVYSAANVPIMYDIYDGIAIPTNMSVGFYAKNGSININYTVVWYYYETEVVT